MDTTNLSPSVVPTGPSSSLPSTKHRVALRGVFSGTPLAPEHLDKCYAFIAERTPCGVVPTSALSIFTSYNGWMSGVAGVRELFDAYVKAGYIPLNECLGAPLAIEWAIIHSSSDTLVALLEHGADERLVPSPAYIKTVPTKNEDGSGITLRPIRDVFDFLKLECNEPEIAARMGAALRANAMQRRIEATTGSHSDIVVAPSRRMRSI